MDYASWIRSMIDRLSREPRDALALFDSAVPEPKALVQELVSEAFREPLTSRYASAFIGGNPYTVAALARRYDVAREAIICTTGATATSGWACGAWSITTSWCPHTTLLRTGM